MQAGLVTTLPKTAAKTPNAIAAFTVGMLIAFASALIYVQVERRAPVHAANISWPERPKVSPAELGPATSRDAVSPTEVSAPEKDQTTPSERAVSTAHTALQHSAATASAASSRPFRPVSDSPAAASSLPAPSNLGVQQTIRYAAPLSFAPPLNVPPQTQSYVPGNAPEPKAVSQPQGNATEQFVRTAQPLTPAAPDSLRSKPTPTFVTLQPGTVIPVRLAETLSSDRNRTGDTFRATLASSLVVNGAVLAQTGSTVLGRVVNARKAPLIGGMSDLSLNLTDITAADGRLVRVDTAVYVQQGSHSTFVNTAKMTTGAAVGAVVGALTGAAEGAGITSGLKGRDRTDGFMATKRIVVLPAGTEAAFALATPVAFPEQSDRGR